jgi:hypothetical protein
MSEGKAPTNSTPASGRISLIGSTPSSALPLPSASSSSSRVRQAGFRLERVGHAEPVDERGERDAAGAFVHARDRLRVRYSGRSQLNAAPTAAGALGPASDPNDSERPHVLQRRLQPTFSRPLRSRCKCGRQRGIRVAADGFHQHCSRDDLAFGGAQPVSVMRQRLSANVTAAITLPPRSLMMSPRLSGSSASGPISTRSPGTIRDTARRTSTFKGMLVSGWVAEASRTRKSCGRSRAIILERLLDERGRVSLEVRRNVAANLIGPGPQALGLLFDEAVHDVERPYYDRRMSTGLGRHDQAPGVDRGVTSDAALKSSCHDFRATTR